MARSSGSFRSRLNLRDVPPAGTLLGRNIRTPSSAASTRQFSWQGKFAEAEADFRSLIALEEKILGPDHPDPFRPVVGEPLQPRTYTRSSRSYGEIIP